MLAQLEGGNEGRLRHRPFVGVCLHRLAFEGQVLLTEIPSEASADPATTTTLRRVQEAVDRVLSGEDVRYDPPQHVMP